MYKCEICGKEYKTIPERAKCEAACVKKLEEDAKRAAEAKKKEEHDARRAEVDMVHINIMVKQDHLTILLYTSSYNISYFNWRARYGS